MPRKAARTTRSEPAQKTTGVTLLNIAPKTANQSKLFADFNSTDGSIVASGLPGTGKTFCLLYLALKAVEDRKSPYSKVVIIRSTVASRNMGFLPGNAAEKAAPYFAFYGKMIADLYGRGDALGILIQKGLIQFETTAFLRGMTLDDAIVLVDEAQNLSAQELHTIASRLGDNTRLLVAGDTGQDDLTSERYKEESGFPEFLKILARMGDLSRRTDFTIDDVVRGGWMKAYLIARFGGNQRDQQAQKALSLID